MYSACWLLAGPLLSPGKNLMAKSQDEMPEEPKLPLPTLQPDSLKRCGINDPQEGGELPKHPQLQWLCAGAQQGAAKV